MLTVRASEIHGRGLFTERFIAEGELIGYVVGTPTEADGPHVLWIDDDGPGIRVVNEMRFINHAVDANAVYYDDLTVVALRDIHAGEEITHNYDGDEAELGGGLGETRAGAGVEHAA